MKSLTFRFSVLGISAVAALVGCGGASVYGFAPPGSNAAASADKLNPRSPAAKSGDLLYVTSTLVFGPSKLYVFTYPGATYVSEVTVPNHPEGLCADKNGNVFVTTLIPNSNTSYIYEYAHGGTQPIATLTDPGGGNSCAVDSVTGNLAVANWSSDSPSSPGNVAIYSNARGVPRTYVAQNISAYLWCAYDSKGDLFVDGINGRHAMPLVELRSGASSFEKVTLDEAVTPSSLQWLDGNLLVANDASISGPELLYRVKFSGSRGKIVGKTVLKSRHGMNSWGGQFVVSGASVTGPSYPRRYFSVWSYPKGGKALLFIARPRVKEFYGVAISASR
ncbi:MAG TPA: hypothetical protein VGI19_13590 [Candidatus Cybelea sp.]|jgi:hypothetical protein